jgi:pimeloyl-ACP methyl ester carboxylesterase
MFALLGTGAASAESICGPDGVQTSGSIYRICMPPADKYNGNLIIWAHGFQDAGTPVQIPEDQLSIGGVPLPALINALGYGFATNSYSKTGLAVRQGMADILDLVDIYTAEQGAPHKVYLTGASEGGVITALLTEQHPEVISAGLAACGPVGSFPYQINYFGDGRLTFDYFFPGLIPGDTFDPPQALVDNWRLYYEFVVKPFVLDVSNRHALEQWVQVAKLPFDANDYLATVEESMRDVLRYAVVNLKDAQTTLGGFPYDNSTRDYTGSDDDALLNQTIARFQADPSALTEMQSFYNTTGVLDNPLITLHTTLDQQVPYTHEKLYMLKTIQSGAYPGRHLNLKIERYGHCNFTVSEAVTGLALMLLYDSAPVDMGVIKTYLEK